METRVSKIGKVIVSGGFVVISWDGVPQKWSEDYIGFCHGFQVWVFCMEGNVKAIVSS